MKNKYKVEDILDAVNTILNNKKNITKKTEKTVLKLINEVKEKNKDFDEIPVTTESIISQAEKYIKEWVTFLIL